MSSKRVQQHLASQILIGRHGCKSIEIDQVCVAISIADCPSIPVTGNEHCTTSTDKLPIVMGDKSCKIHYHAGAQ